MHGLLQVAENNQDVSFILYDLHMQEIPQIHADKRQIMMFVQQTNKYRKLFVLV